MKSTSIRGGGVGSSTHLWGRRRTIKRRSALAAAVASPAFARGAMTALAVGTAVLSAHRASATNYYWNTSTGLFEMSGNWLNGSTGTFVGAPKAATDSADISNGGLAELGFGTTTTYTVGNLSTGVNVSGGSGTYLMNGSTTLVTVGGTTATTGLLLGQTLNSAGLLQMNAGTFNTTAGSSFMIGNAGSGTFDVAAGAANILNGTLTNVVVGNTSTGVGTINLMGGTFADSASGIIVGNAGTGTLNVSGGAYTDGFRFVLGNVSSGVGTLLVSGGTFSETGTGVTSVGIGGIGRVVQTGGVINAGGIVALGNGSTGVGTVSVSGTSTFNATTGLYVGDASGGRGTLILSGGGTITTTNVYAGRSGTASGVINQAGGTIVASGNFNISGSVAADTATTGTYTLTSGTLTAGNTLGVGSYGIGGMFQSGGTVTVNAPASIGQNTTGYGVADIAGGTFTQNASTGRVLVGESGAGVLDVRAGGVLNVAGFATGGLNGGAAVAGGAALDLAKNNGSSGIVNLGVGGIINTPNVGTSSAGTSIFDFHGGSLQTTANTSSAIAFVSGLTNAYVYSEGAVINTAASTAGANALITQPLLAPTGDGLASIPTSAINGGAGYQSAPVVRITGGTGTGATAVATVVNGVVAGFTITNPGSGYSPTDQLTVTLSGGLPSTAAAVTTGGATLAVNTSGSLTKSGGNTLTLTPTAANTYTGGTIVNGGTLVTGNNLALPAGTALTNNGAAVNLNGSYLSAALTNPADPTTATPGLTLSTLASAAGAFSFNVSSTSADYLAFSGAANVSAGSLIGLNFPVGISLTAGTYDLLSASLSGSTLGNFSLNQSSVSTGGLSYALSLQTAATSTTEYEELVIGTGQVAKLYFANGAGGSLNVASNYTVDQPGTNTSSATPTSNTDVFFTAATAGGSSFMATQDGLTVVNSLEFNSSGAITVAPGTATVPLTISAGSNTFVAGTGIVVDAGAGADTISANLALPRSESFLNNSTSPLTLTGTVSGAGTTLTYGGTGTGGFTVAGSNTYTGGTAVAVPAGTVVTLANTAALGPASNTVSVASGTLALNGLAVTQSALNLAGGSVSGAGTLTLTSTAAAVQVPVGANYSSASPALSSTLALSGSTNSIVKAAGGAAGGTPVLSGNIALGGNTTVVVADTSGDAAPELALTGVIGGTGSLTLADNAPPAGVAVANTSDNGTLFLGGSNTYGGGTNINYGRLVVASNNALSTGTVTINIGAGNNSGGTLQLGDANYTATTSPLAVASTVNGLSIPNAITLGGATNGNNSAGIINAVGNNTLAGPVTLANANQVISVASGTTLTVSGSIGSAAAATTSTFLSTPNAALGTLLLTGNNTYVGGTSVGNGGTVRVGSITALGSTANTVVVTGTNTSRGVLDLNGMSVTQATLNLSGGQLGDLVGGGLLTLNNPSGPAILVPVGQGYGPFNTPAGVGSISLAGTTNYVVRAAGGTSNGPVLTGGLALSGNSIFALADTTGDTVPEFTVTGVVSGPGVLSVADNNTASGITPTNTSDTGTLLLTNSNTYTGGTNISYGRIVIANAAALGTGTVTIGGITNASGGTLQLGNANYNSGNSTLSIANNFTALTVANNINLSGATSGNYSAGIINNVGVNTLGGTLSLTAAAEAINVSGGSLTLAGPISSTGNTTLTLTGTTASSAAAPAFTLSGTNTFTGNLVIGNTTNATYVRAGSSAALGSTSGMVSLIAGVGASGTAPSTTFGVLDVFGQSLATGALNMAGGRVIDSAATPGTLTLTAGGGSTGLALTFNSPLNAYTSPLGVAIISGPTLALPNGGYVTKPANVGFPVVGSNVVLGGPATVALSQNGTGNAGPELQLAGNISGAGSITLANNATVPGAAITTVSDEPTLELSGGNTYAGGTTVSYGRVLVNNAAALGSGTVTVNGAVGSTGGTLQVGTTTLSSPLANANTSGTSLVIANALVLGGATTGTYGAALVNGTGTNTFSGPVSLTQSQVNVNVSSGTTLTLSGVVSGTGNGLATTGGAGPLILTNADTYTGATTVGAGTVLQLGTGTAGQDGTIAFTSGVTDNGTLAYNRNGTANTAGYVISGTGTVTMTGLGKQVLAAANTYSGGTTITSGTLRAENATTSLGSGPVNVNSGGTLAGGTSAAANTGSGAVNVNAGGTITAGTGGTAADAVGTLLTGGLETWNSGGTYVAKLNGGDTASDQLILSSLSVAPTGFVVNVVGVNATTATGQYVLAVDTTGTPGQSFDVSGLALEVNGAAAPSSYSLSDVSDTTGFGGDDLLLSTTASPEPTSLLLAISAAGPLALGRRRRSAKR